MVEGEYNLIVTCVYKTGGDYTAEYVKALKKQLDTHMPVPFEFWCFTDAPEEVSNMVDKVVILRSGLKGWWSKIELFRPIYQAQLVIYFDLDVMILDNLHWFINAVEDYRPLMLRSSDPVGKEKDWPSSSIMAWQGNELHDIYLQFMRHPEENIAKMMRNVSRAGQRTDQGFIRTIINPNKFQDYLPDGFVLFKNEYMRNPQEVEKAHILNWTGKPRYKEISNNNHLKQIWNEAVN